MHHDAQIHIYSLAYNYLLYFTFIYNFCIHHTSRSRILFKFKQKKISSIKLNTKLRYKRELLKITFSFKKKSF